MEIGQNETDRDELVSVGPADSESGAARTRPCLRNWKRWIRPVFYAAYGLLVAISLPLVILDIVNTDRNFQITLSVVGFFAMVICIPISVWGIMNHMMCYTKPALQKYIIRILWMIPIFELDSWFSLRFPAARIYLDTLTQLYQAFVIYTYVFYLLAFFEEVPGFHARLVAKPPIKSPPPCCCIGAVSNRRVINRCKAGVLNYTVIRIIFTAISIITDIAGKFNEGNYSPKFAFFWVTLIVSISQVWAIFCMVLLRRASREELQMLPRSTGQFVGIQLVIFSINFQSVLLTLLAQFGVLTPRAEWGYESPAAFASMLQDFLVCLELILGAVLFSYSFDYQRYNTHSEHRMLLTRSFKHMFNVSDVRRNLVEHLRFGGYTLGRQDSESLPISEQPPDRSHESPATVQGPLVTVEESASSEDKTLSQSYRVLDHQEDLSENSDLKDDTTQELTSERHHIGGGEDGRLQHEEFDDLMNPRQDSGN